MNYVLTLCTASCEHDELYDDYDVDIRCQNLTLADLGDLTQHYNLREDLMLLLTALLNSGDERVILVAKEAGFVNVDQIRDRETKLAASKQFWIISKERYGVIETINIDNIPSYLLLDLANDKVQVVQIITKTSVKKLLSPEDKKMYDKHVKGLKKQKEKRAAVAKKQKETKKQKEIEKAKKILGVE